MGQGRRGADELTCLSLAAVDGDLKGLESSHSFLIIAGQLQTPSDILIWLSLGLFPDSSLSRCASGCRRHCCCYKSTIEYECNGGSAGYLVVEI